MALQELSFEETNMVSGGDAMNVAAGWAGGVAGVAAATILTVGAAPLGVAALAGFAVGYGLSNLAQAAYAAASNIPGGNGVPRGLNPPKNIQK